MLADITLSGLLIALTRGSWASPYFLYGLTSILVASFFLDLKTALATTVYYNVLFIGGIVLNKDTLVRIIVDKNIDLLFTS